MNGKNCGQYLVKAFGLMIIIGELCLTVSSQGGQAVASDRHGDSKPNTQKTADNSDRTACSHESGVILVSPFSGSSVVAEYKVEFERLVVLEGAEKERKEVTAEGCFSSHIYRKPEEKSTFEIYRSYERELKASGFTILSGITNAQESKTLTRKLYSGSGKNSLRNRDYNFLVDKPNLELLSFSQYYLSAKKDSAGKSVYVSIMLSNPSTVKYNHEYVVDVVESAGFEAGTVSVSAESIAQKIDAEGKAAIYSIYFDVDKAVLLPSSKPALSAIATYLKRNPDKSFYVVGHTDSTGSLNHNMDLSNRRARAVAASLKADYGVQAGQVESVGVGPAAPVASNTSEEGRALNRRVELVLK